MLLRFHPLTWLVAAVIFAACMADRAPAGPPARETGSAIQPAGEAGTKTDAAPVDTPEEPQPAVDVITADGWGPLRIGMSVDEITAAAGPDANPAAVGGAEPERCDEFRPRNAPQGVLVMVENGVLTRISVSRNRDIRTADGFRIGDPESRVVGHYGSRARVEPHKYLASPAKNIVVLRAPRTGVEARGIRYEIGLDGTIAHIRAGGPSIEYVEGCS